MQPRAMGHRLGKRAAAATIAALLLLAGSPWVLAKRHYAAALGMDLPRERVAAPEFTVRSPDGQPLSLKDFRGKVVFLNFWATWCPPCRVEMPSMEKLYREFKDRGFVVVALDLNESAESVKAFVKSMGLTFPVGIDLGNIVFFEYRGRGLPTTMLIDGQGRVVGRAIGARDWHSDDAREFIGMLLKGKR